MTAYERYDANGRIEWIVYDRTGRVQVTQARHAKVEWGVLYLFDNDLDMFGTMVKCFNKDQWQTYEPRVRGE